MSPVGNNRFSNSHAGNSAALASSAQNNNNFNPRHDFSIYGNVVNINLNKFLESAKKENFGEKKWETVVNGLGKAIEMVGIDNKEELLQKLKFPLQEICRSLVDEFTITHQPLCDAYENLRQATKIQNKPLRELSKSLVNYLKEITPSAIHNRIETCNSSVIQLLSINDPNKSYSGNKRKFDTPYPRTRSFGAISNYTLGSQRNHQIITPPAEQKIRVDNDHKKTNAQASIKISKDSFICERVANIKKSKFGFPKAGESPVDINLVFIIPTRGKIKSELNPNDLDIFTQIQSIQDAIQSACNCIDKNNLKAVVYVGLNIPVSKRENICIDEADQQIVLSEIIEDFDKKMGEAETHLETSKNLMVEVSPFTWKMGDNNQEDLMHKDGKRVVPYGTIRNSVTNAALSAINDYTKEGVNILPKSKLIFLDGDIKITESAIRHVINLEDNQFTSLPFFPDPHEEVKTGTSKISRQRITSENKKAFEIHWSLANEMYFEVPGAPDDRPSASKVSLCYPAEPCLIVGSNWLDKIYSNSQDKEGNQTPDLFGSWKLEGLNAKDRLESKGFYFSQFGYKKDGDNISSPHVLLTNTERFKIDSAQSKNPNEPKEIFKYIAKEHSQNLSNIRNFATALGAGLGLDKNELMKLAALFWAPNVLNEYSNIKGEPHNAKNYISNLRDKLIQRIKNDTCAPKSEKSINRMSNAIKKMHIPNSTKYTQDQDAAENFHRKVIQTEVVNNMARWAQKSIDLIESTFSPSSPQKIKFSESKLSPPVGEDKTEEILKNIERSLINSKDDNPAQITNNEFTCDPWRKDKSTIFKGLFDNSTTSFAKPKKVHLKSGVTETNKATQKQNHLEQIADDKFGYELEINSSEGDKNFYEHTWANDELNLDQNLFSFIDVPTNPMVRETLDNSSSLHFLADSKPGFSAQPDRNDAFLTTSFDPYEFDELLRSFPLTDETISSSTINQPSNKDSIPTNSTQNIPEDNNETPINNYTTRTIDQTNIDQYLASFVKINHKFHKILSELPTYFEIIKIRINNFQPGNFSYLLNLPHINNGHPENILSAYATYAPALLALGLSPNEVSNILSSTGRSGLETAATVAKIFLKPPLEFSPQEFAKMASAGRASGSFIRHLEPKLSLFNNPKLGISNIAIKNQLIFLARYESPKEKIDDYLLSLKL